MRKFYFYGDSEPKKKALAESRAFSQKSSMPPGSITRLNRRQRIRTCSTPVLPHRSNGGHLEGDEDELKGETTVNKGHLAPLLQFPSYPPTQRENRYLVETVGLREFSQGVRRLLLRTGFGSDVWTSPVLEARLRNTVRCTPRRLYNANTSEDDNHNLYETYPPARAGDVGAYSDSNHNSRVQKGDKLRVPISVVSRFSFLRNTFRKNKKQETTEICPLLSCDNKIRYREETGYEVVDRLASGTRFKYKVSTDESADFRDTALY
ncbi:hypothetical protein AAG570_007258 [Ranatra chinensis]|uniref:Uncharacterized protein n=1 Tax=Ranatra chinensis TaxID=642074 RepID=A0ABD0XWJ2_9HEMI